MLIWVKLGSAIKKMQATPGYTVNLRTVSPGKVEIERIISGFGEAEIKPNGEMILSLQPETDEIIVNISGMEVEMDYSVAGSSILQSRGKITFQISADQEEIVIGGISANILVKSPDVNFAHEISGSGTVKAGWDKEIWKHWDGTEKTLQHAGR